MVDQVTVNNDPNSSPEQDAAQAEHDKKMLEAADAGVNPIDGAPPAEEGTGDSQVAERPADIPEKFWNAEKGEVNVPALLKSQQDAEAALLAAKQGDKPDADKSEGEVEEDASSDSQSNAVEAANAEYAEKGELSEETYAALQKQGLDRGMVDAYIAGQEAIVEKLTNSAYSAFEGSEENYRAAQRWAKDNLSEDEIKALDVQLGSDNPAIVSAGAKALAEKFAAEADITPETVVVGDGGRTDSSGAYFKSSKEMQDAMADPRYKDDAAFRQEVADKIARASAADIKLFG